MTLKNEMFCQAWVDHKGNATWATLEVFDITGKEIFEEGPKKDKKGNITDVARIEWKKECRRVESVASSVGNEYLRKPAIRARIDQILEERGFNDDSVKREHYKIMAQDKDLSAKMRAVSDYYKLKGKYTPEESIVRVVKTVDDIYNRL